MTEENERVQLYYSHISRLYSGGFSILFTVILGWITFFGFTLNLITNSFNSQKHMLCGLSCIGAIIIIMMVYFFYRLLFFSRLLCHIENDLNLGDYIENIPKWGIWRASFVGLNRRSNCWKDWKETEIVLTALLTILVVKSIIILWYAVPA